MAYLGYKIYSDEFYIRQKARRLIAELSTKELEESNIDLLIVRQEITMELEKRRLRENECSKL